MFMFLQHLSNITVGVSAGMAIVFFLYVLGVVSFPSTRINNTKETYQAVAIGAAIATLWCWYGIKLNYPLLPALLVLFWLTVILAAFRIVRSGINSLFSSGFVKGSVQLLVLYSFFYALIYSFFPMGPWSEYLPLARMGNNDIFNYINYASYLQRLGESNIPGYSFIDNAMLIYEVCPAVYYALAGMAKFFGDETLWSAMPTLFGVVALIACVFVHFSRWVFGISKPLAVGISAVLISGSFFRYIVGNYFLSQLIALLVVLLLLAKTSEWLASSGSIKKTSMVLTFAPYHILLFFTYPPIFVIGLGLQLSYVFLFSLFSVSHQQGVKLLIRALIKMMLPWLTITLICVAIACLVDPFRAFKILKFMFLLAKPGVAGWPLPMVSPIAILGFPGPFTINHQAAQLPVAVLFIATIVITGFFSLFHVKATNFARALFALAVLNFAAYFMFWLYSGPTYQQWKLASYLLFPISFVALIPFAIVVQKVCQQYMSLNSAQTEKFALLLLCFIFVMGNRVYSRYWWPPIDRPALSYSNLRVLDAMGGWNEAYIQMNGFSNTFMPVYFVRNKKLHLLSRSYYPDTKLDASDISTKKPLFIEGESCSLDAGHIPIEGVGCLLLVPPSFEPGSTYVFSKNILGLEALGLSGIEPWGRWSDGNFVDIQLVLNPKDWGARETGYINLEVRPLLSGKITSQDISISWGKGRSVRTSVQNAVWISLPYGEEDWQVGQLNKLQLKFDLPGATAPKDIDPNSGDTRKLALGFLTISLSEKPMGPILDAR